MILQKLWNSYENCQNKSDIFVAKKMIKITIRIVQKSAVTKPG